MVDNHKDDILYIQEWMKKEPQLPEPFDDDMTLMFLHSTYYSLEQTKKCIERFCTSRHNMPHVYLQRDPFLPNLKNSLHDAASYRCDDMDILLFRFDDNVNTFVFNDLLKVVSLKIDYYIKFDHHITKQHVIVLDVKSISMKHLAKVNPILMKDYITYLLEGMPVRIKKIFLINAPPVTDLFFNIIKPVLSANIIEIVNICPDDKMLRKFVNQKNLPSDYGGERKNFQESSKEMYEGILKHREMFLDDNLWKGDASKIVKKADANIMNGSFRTLSID